MEALLELLERGGPALWIVTVILLAGVVLGLERLVSLTKNKCAPHDFEKDVVHIADTKGIDAAIAHCRLKPSAMGRVLIAALARHGSTRAELEDAVRHETRLARQQSMRHVNICGWLAVFALLVGIAGVCANALQVSLPYRFQDEPDSANGGEMALVVLGKGIMVGMPGLTLAIIAATVLLALFALARGRARTIAVDIESRAVEAIVTLDRKARQSIRLVEDLEDRIKTESMIKIPDLSAEFEDSQHTMESAVKTAVTTHAGLPAGSGIVKAPESNSTSSKTKLPQQK